ncbi:hypothetical protein CMU45_02575 [Elizabethkingia anophelis]|nr:hypothetical protein [Elizabethkingia anophelis]
MKNLKNGCKRTEVFVSPKNYKILKGKADLNKNWSVECRFFDPKFKDKYPDGFQYRKKFNKSKCETIQEQKVFAEIMKSEMENMLDNHNYNPITKEYTNNNKGEITPYTLFIDALELAQKKVKGVYEHKKQVLLCINRLKPHIESLNYDVLQIKDIKIWHFMNVLEAAELTASTYNHYRSYLMSLCKALIPFGCMEHNPIRDIPKQKTVTKIREILSDEEYEIVCDYLRGYNYNFYRYFQIFYHSAGRTPELFRVRAKDVDINNQEYRTIIYKGRQYYEVVKVIFPQAIPFWKELLSLARSPNDFLFGPGLIPNSNKVERKDSITMKWSRWIKNNKKLKDKYGNTIEITADFYSNKHRFLDKLDEAQSSGKLAPIVDINLAQKAANHKSGSTTKIYTTGKTKRENEILKLIKIG